jgi:hypothetical protein
MDTDRYSIYRNIFDNLLTRDADGKIVPQVATAWRYVSDTVIDFDIRADVKFHDGWVRACEFNCFVHTLTLNKFTCHPAFVPDFEPGKSEKYRRNTLLCAPSTLKSAPLNAPHTLHNCAKL